MSRASVASRFVRDEATEGLDGRLVPVFIEAVRQPLGFRQLQAAELGSWQGARPHVEFDRLVDSIAAIVPVPTVSLVGSSEAITDAIPWVGGTFDADVYISAVESDDVAINADRSGWVTHLRRALTIRLAQFLGDKPVVRNAQQEHVRAFVEGHVAMMRAASTSAVVDSTSFNIRPCTTQRPCWTYTRARTRACVV